MELWPPNFLPHLELGSYERDLLYFKSQHNAQGQGGHSESTGSAPSPENRAEAEAEGPPPILWVRKQMACPWAHGQLGAEPGAGLLKQGSRLSGVCGSDQLYDPVLVNALFPGSVRCSRTPCLLSAVIGQCSGSWRRLGPFPLILNLHWIVQGHNGVKSSFLGKGLERGQSLGVFLPSC